MKCTGSVDYLPWLSTTHGTRTAHWHYATHCASATIRNNQPYTRHVVCLSLWSYRATWSGRPPVQSQEVALPATPSQTLTLTYPLPSWRDENRLLLVYCYAIVMLYLLRDRHISTDIEKFSFCSVTWLMLSHAKSPMGKRELRPQIASDFCSFFCELQYVYWTLNLTGVLSVYLMNSLYMSNRCNN